MSNDDKLKILNILKDFILRVASENDKKTPDEVAILPTMCQLLLEHSYALDI